jgi:hypothetical protein
MKLFISAIITLTTLNTYAAPCSGSISGSCASKTDKSVCLDAVANAMPMPTFESQCAADPDSIFSASPCTTSALVGSCSMANGMMVLRMYPPVTAEYVDYICSQVQGTVCQ